MGKEIALMYSAPPPPPPPKTKNSQKKKKKKGGKEYPHFLPPPPPPQPELLNFVIKQNLKLYFENFPYPVSVQGSTRYHRVLKN